MQALQAFFDKYCGANGKHPDCTMKDCYYNSGVGCWHPRNPAKEIDVALEIAMERTLAGGEKARTA
jgi:hypothetical protein